MDSRPQFLLFRADSEPVNYLRSRDPDLARLIDMVGDITLNLRGTPFASLVRSIIGQQLSGIAAAAIWNKLQAACGEVSPASLSCLDDATLRATGLSRPKVAYLRDLTARAMSGEIDLEMIRDLPDDRIIAKLIAVNGIGVWTAQMFLIFCLGRMDVFAPKDLGLRAAMKWLYVLPDLPAEKESVPIAERWRPYRTVASLYLWQAVTRKLIQ